MTEKSANQRFDALLKAVIVVMSGSVQTGIAHEIIGIDAGIGFYVLDDMALQGRFAAIGQDAGDYRPASFQHSHDGCLASPAAMIDAADIGFVHLNSTQKATKLIVAIDNRHIFADFVAHAPSCFVGHSNLALHFLGSNAVARCTEQKHDIEPVAQASAGPVEGRSGSRIDLKAAMLTGIGAAGRYAIEMRILAALFAVMAITIASTHKMFQAAIFRWEAVLELAKGRGFLFHTHCIAENITCRKGIITVKQAFDAGFTVSDILWIAGELQLRDIIVKFANDCAARAKGYAAARYDAADAAARYAARYADDAAARYADDAADAAEITKQKEHLMELLK